MYQLVISWHFEDLQTSTVKGGDGLLGRSTPPPSLWEASIGLQRLLAKGKVPAGAPSRDGGKVWLIILLAPSLGGCLGLVPLHLRSRFFSIRLSPLDSCNQSFLSSFLLGVATVKLSPVPD